MARQLSSVPGTGILLLPEIVLPPGATLYTIPRFVLEAISLLLVGIVRVLLGIALSLPRCRAACIQRWWHAAVGLQEVLVCQQSARLVVLLARDLRHVLALDLARGNLLHDVGDEFIYGTLHLLVVHRQIGGLVNSCTILEHCQRPAHAVGPPLHVLHLQSALLEAPATLFVLLEHLIETALVFFDLQIDITGTSTRICIEGQAVSVSFEALELISQIL
mmetsp:Transcript_50274/g.162759  ORF Transcript_50274/g.162759 Transcript_50274/m.162759 type:complete len:219 (+) Transcript_50274:132-788(+)